MNESVITTRKEGCLIVKLNRPGSFNAFTVGMHESLLSVLEGIANDPAIRCVVLTGSGKAFCAGQDLAEASEPDGPVSSLGRHLERYYNPLIRAVRNAPVPVIAAVSGVAAGAGAGLAMACDIVLAAKSAKFVMAFAKLGLVPDSGATWMFPRIAGSMRARATFLLGESVDAQTAQTWGLVWQVFDDEDLLPGAMKLSAKLQSMPISGLTLTKRALDASLMNTLDQQLDTERDLQEVAGQSADYREAVAAFMERRPPQFSTSRN